MLLASAWVGGGGWLPGTGPLTLCGTAVAHGGSLVMVGYIYHHSPLPLVGEKPMGAVMWT